ncbi:MAG: DNA-protecting protein DprA [Ignavibacteriae bacterium]|nr:MAG: DNA-protecting protein DprA [Ignavibacteriota bacterium]
MDDFKYIYFLTKAEGLGAVRTKKLIDVFKDPEIIFKASYNELVNVDGISHNIAKAIRRQYANTDKLESDFELLLKKIDKLNIRVSVYTDKDYPNLLKKIYDPPVILYYKGCANDGLNNALANGIGIVGTRTPSEYGKKISAVFAEELSSIGVTVISGFARGIDTIAHKAVLSNNKRKSSTAAVFGNGVDVVYPPENRKLYDSMCEEGLVISECDISAKPDSVNFPRRNRIISGLSYGILIVESGKEGGALITARCALDQSREVFAVPGDINSKVSRGTNELIKNGLAKLVNNIDDILEELHGKMRNINGEKIVENRVTAGDLKGNEKILFEIISNNNDAMHIDAISEKTGFNISDCLVLLLNLEFKGYIKQLPGKIFNIS